MKTANQPEPSDTITAGERPMAIATVQPSTAPPGPAEQPGFRLHVRWAALWVFLTTFAVFAVVKHGFVNGSATNAVSALPFSVDRSDLRSRFT